MGLGELAESKKAIGVCGLMRDSTQAPKVNIPEMSGVFTHGAFLLMRDSAQDTPDISVVLLPAPVHDTPGISGVLGHYSGCPSPVS